MSKVRQTLATMLHDLRADRDGYAQLRMLLDAQFQAALQHQGGRLSELAQAISDQVDELGRRRDSRSQALSALLGPQVAPKLGALLPRLPAQLASAMADSVHDLEKLVGECKQMNVRNCELITAQHQLMQQAMGVREHGYAER